MFSLLRNCQTVFQWLYHSTFLVQCRMVYFLCMLARIWSLIYFDHIDSGIYCCFNLHFPNGYCGWTSFCVMLSLYIIWHFVTIYTVSKSTFTITSIYHLMFLFYFRHIHFHSTICSHQAHSYRIPVLTLERNLSSPKHKGHKLTFSISMNVFLKSLDFYSNFPKKIWLCEWVI